MEKIFEDIKFKYKFRDYQEKALTMLEKYIKADGLETVKKMAENYDYFK